MLIKRSFIIIALLAGLLVLLVIYKHFDPLEFSFFPKCPVKHFTGLDCPGCGGQRAVHHLLNGDFKEAFYQNPLLFFLAPYIVLGFYLQLIPKPTINELKLRHFLFGHRAIYILLVIIILFTVLRNIV